jgi:hypothetical protein
MTSKRGAGREAPARWTAASIPPAYQVNESAGGARTSSWGGGAGSGAGEVTSGPSNGSRATVGGAGWQVQRQVGMRSIREWLLPGARVVEGVRVGDEGERQGRETAGAETRQAGEYEGAGGPWGSESSGRRGAEGADPEGKRKPAWRGGRPKTARGGGGRRGGRSWQRRTEEGREGPRESAARPHGGL